MPFPLALLALSGLSALGGALSSKTKQTTTPVLPAAYTPLQNTILQQMQARLTSPSALPAGFETGGIGAINRTYDLVGQGLANSLTARGLGSSPVAAAGETNAALRRAGDISTFRAGLPLIERELRTNDLNDAVRLLSISQGHQTVGTSGGGLAGSMSNLAGMLGFLLATGQLGGKQ